MFRKERRYDRYQIYFNKRSRWDHGLSTRRVVGLCNAGKLEGALGKGRNWKVPEETSYAYIGTEKPKAGNGEDKHYDTDTKDRGIKEIVKYGIAFAGNYAKYIA